MEPRRLNGLSVPLTLSSRTSAMAGRGERAGSRPRRGCPAPALRPADHRPTSAQPLRWQKLQQLPWVIRKGPHTGRIPDIVPLSPPPKRRSETSKGAFPREGYVCDQPSRPIIGLYAIVAAGSLFFRRTAFAVFWR